jgi:hypothetical protein
MAMRGGAKPQVCRAHGRYLGAMPRQNLPFTAGQRHLLLDGALKFICKKEKKEAVTGAQYVMMGPGALRPHSTRVRWQDSCGVQGAVQDRTCCPVSALCMAGPAFLKKNQESGF